MSFGFNSAPEDFTQDLLDRSGDALMARDFDAMKSCFLLPQGFSTFDGKRMVETEADLKKVFDDVCDEFARQGVTRVIRTIVAAERKSEHRIEATHMTHLFAGNTRIKEPVPVFAITQWTGTEWRVSSSDYAVEPGTNYSRALSGAAKTPLPVGEQQ